MKYDVVQLSHTKLAVQLVCATLLSFAFAFQGSDVLLVIMTDLYSCMLLNVLLYLVATTVLLTPLVDMDTVYYAVLMWDHVSAMASSCMGALAAQYLCSCVTVHKLTRLWMVFTVLAAAQRCLLYYLTSITIWKAYLPRIKNTVLAHEVITGLSAFVARCAPTPEEAAQKKELEQSKLRRKTSLFDVDRERASAVRSPSSLKREMQFFGGDTVPLHSVHAAVRMDALEYLTSMDQVADLYDRILYTVQYGTAPVPPVTLYKPVLRLLNMGPKAAHATSRQDHTTAALLTGSHMHRVFSSNSNLAEAALKLLDKNDDGSVDKAEFLSSFADMASRRKDLQSTIADYESMAAVLDRALTCATYIIMFFVVLLIFDVNVVANASFILSLFVAMSIAFGSTLQAFFEGIIFAFAVRPYDVGDRIFVRDETGSEQNYIVTRITLMVTVFRRVDGIAVTVSNRKLRDLVIVNAYRADTACHKVTFKLPVDFDCAVLQELVHRVRGLNIPHVTEVDVIYDSVRADGMSTTAFLIAVQNQSFQDIALKASISNVLHIAIHSFFREKELQPIHAAIAAS